MHIAQSKVHITSSIICNTLTFTLCILANALKLLSRQPRHPTGSEWVNNSNRNLQAIYHMHPQNRCKQVYKKRPRALEFNYANLSLINQCKKCYRNYTLEHTAIEMH
jgi:hypothetical protein